MQATVPSAQPSWQTTQQFDSFSGHTRIPLRQPQPGYTSAQQQPHCYQADVGTSSFEPFQESTDQCENYQFDDFLDSLSDSDYVSSRPPAVSEYSCTEDMGGFLASKDLPPPPFKTPEKLKPVERVMQLFKGTDTATLRLLSVALAKDCIFGREELSKKSLSGKHDTQSLDFEKLHYIKTLEIESS